MQQNMIIITDEVAGNSTVGVAMGFGLHNQVQFLAGARNYVLSPAFIPALGSTQTPMQWVLGLFHPY
jgi:hypothetical protein